MWRVEFEQLGVLWTEIRDSQQGEQRFLKDPGHQELLSTPVMFPSDDWLQWFWRFYKVAAVHLLRRSRVSISRLFLFQFLRILFPSCPVTLTSPLVFGSSFCWSVILMESVCSGCVFYSHRLLLETKGPVSLLVSGPATCVLQVLFSGGT